MYIYLGKINKWNNKVPADLRRPQQMPKE